MLKLDRIKNEPMQNLTFPINLVFKVSTLANDFIAKDANNRTVAYVRQKMFKLKEEIIIYSDEDRKTINYKINANKWLDFSAAYAFTDANGNKIGKIARKGWASIWKAEYEIIDQHDKLQYKINEENAWTKIMDSLLGQIPILSMLTGYLFNPAYSVTNTEGQLIARLKKEPSFFGRKFQIIKEGQIDNDDDDRIMLSLMMMVLLERRRG